MQFLIINQMFYLSTIIARIPNLSQGNGCTKHKNINLMLKFNTDSFL